MGKSETPRKGGSSSDKKQEARKAANKSAPSGAGAPRVFIDLLAETAVRGTIINLAEAVNDSNFEPHGASSLHIACAEGSVEAVEILLLSNVEDDVNIPHWKDQSTPLHIASQYGHADVVSELISRGSDVNARNKHKLTPLHMSVRHLTCEVTNVLVDSDVDIEAKTEDNSTPLLHAAFFGNQRACSVLLARGANVNTCNVFGVSPLHIASVYNIVDLVELMCVAGADVNMKDETGLTPLDGSAKSKLDGITSYLNEYKTTGSAQRLRGKVATAGGDDDDDEFGDVERSQRQIEEFEREISTNKVEGEGSAAMKKKLEKEGDAYDEMMGNYVNEQIQEELKNLRAELEEEKKKRSEVEAKYKKYKEISHAAKRDVDSSKTEVESLRAEMGDLKVAKEAAEAQLEDKEKTIQAKNLEIEAKAKEIKAISEKGPPPPPPKKKEKEKKEEKAPPPPVDTEEIKKLNMKIESDAATIKSMSTELDGLKKALAKAQQSSEKTAADHKSQVDSLNKKITDLQGQLEKKTEEADKLGKKAESAEARAGKADEATKKYEAAVKAQKESEKLLATQSGRVKELEKLYKDELVQKKKYYNQIQDMKGKIRVYARCRPMLGHETKRKDTLAVEFSDEYTVNVNKEGAKEPKTFMYDAAFGPGTSQDDIFKDTCDLVQSAMDGYNVCIFAYGQTGKMLKQLWAAEIIDSVQGSGKTFTMYGNEGAPGITPRAMKEIFRIIDRDKDKFDVKLRVYMLELYRDEIVDALAGNKKPKLEVKKDPKGMVYVENVVEKEAKTLAEMQGILDAAMKKRHVSATKMNEESSRSHFIFSTIIESTNKQTSNVIQGKITLVDLAGSERLKKSGATGEAMKEAQSINKSLTALGNVIEALSTNAAHVPYRDHKLTQLMSDSLGGNAKTLMFVNISPSNYNEDETVNSLSYAKRVKLITNDAKKNEEGKQVAKMKKVIQTLSMEIARLKGDAPE